MMDFIKGATFDYAGPVTLRINGTVQNDMTGWTAESHIRDLDGRLIADLEAELIQAAPPVLRLWSAQDTNSWRGGPAKINVRFRTPDGQYVHTQNADLMIVNGATR